MVQNINTNISSLLFWGGGGYTVLVINTVTVSRFTLLTAALNPENASEVTLELRHFLSVRSFSSLS